MLTLSVAQLETSPLGFIASQRVQVACIAFLASVALLSRLIYISRRQRPAVIIGAPVIFVGWSILCGIANIDVVSQWSVLILYAALLILPLMLMPTFSSAALQGVLIASLFQILFALATQDFLVTLSGVAQLSGGAHPNILGLMACYVSISGLYFFFSDRAHAWHKTLALVLLGLGVLSLVLSVSRSGMISFLIASCLFLIFSVKRLWVSFLVVGTTSAFVLLLNSRWFLETSTSWFVRGDASNLSSLTGRTNIWDLSLRLISEKPFLGWGFGALYSEDYSAGFFLRQVEGTNTHNAWMQFALETGVVGLTLMLIFLVAAVYQSWRLDQGYFRDYCLALYVLIVVNGMVSASFATIGVACLMLSATVAASSWGIARVKKEGQLWPVIHRPRDGAERQSVST